MYLEEFCVDVCAHMIRNISSELLSKLSGDIVIGRLYFKVHHNDEVGCNNQYKLLGS